MQPELASLSGTQSWALIETKCQCFGGQWRLANILKYLINLSVDCRESHALLVSLSRGSSQCPKFGVESRIFKDASLSVSTASARMCRGDTNELPALPFVGLYSGAYSSDLTEVYASETASVSGVCSVESLPPIVFEAELEDCRFRDEARMAAMTCSPTGLSLIRCKSFSTVSGLL